MIHRYQETNQNPKLRVNKKTTNIDRMINRLAFANICFLKPHYVEIDILPDLAPATGVHKQVIEGWRHHSSYYKKLYRPKGYFKVKVT